MRCLLLALVLATAACPTRETKPDSPPQKIRDNDDIELLGEPTNTDPPRDGEVRDNEDVPLLKKD